MKATAITNLGYVFCLRLPFKLFHWSLLFFICLIQTYKIYFTNLALLQEIFFIFVGNKKKLWNTY